VLDALYLPAYKGSTLRGGLGHVFKRIICIKRDKKCEDCILRMRCAYSYCFETPAEDIEKARSSNWPHPYILEPPLEEKTKYERGEEMVFNLILLGKGIDYLPYYIFVFDELGKRGIGRRKGRYLLERVESDDGVPIYINDSNILSYGYEIKTFDNIVKETTDIHSHRIDLRFLTPTRIKYRSHFTKEIDFRILMENLLRRISFISYYHCDEQFDPGDIIGRARIIKTRGVDLHWQDWNRYSTRQNVKMKLGGFIGEISFEGALKEFMPFIKLGEYIHVGKGTSFGLGKYEIV